MLTGANNLCMENKVRLVHKFALYKDRKNKTFTEKQITHSLQKAGKTPCFTNRRLVKKYEVMGNTYCLYEKAAQK